MYNPLKPHISIILDQIKRTWDNRWCTVTEGTYPVIRRKINFQEVDHTDGIGTKGIYHWNHRTFKNAVTDALAMNINDLAMCRATPYKLQNHIIMPADDQDAVTEIITFLADECVKREIAITGGELSIHDNQKCLEISITMSGWTDHVYPNVFRTGQLLIGLPSSGLHSNGFTALRHLMPTESEVKPEWFAPTKIYKLPNVPMSIVGIQHITGGAFAKLKNRLSKDSDIHIHRNHPLKPHDVFYELYKHYLTDEPMYRTFNCGIGMVLGITPDTADHFIKEVGGAIIGKVTSGEGRIFIESMFSNTTVAL